MCAAAIWRATTITFNMTDDADGDVTPFATEMCVAFAECNGAVICAAIPAMAKFLAQYLARNFTRYMDSLKSSILYRAPSLPTSERRPPPARPGVYGGRAEKVDVGSRTDSTEAVTQPAPSALVSPRRAPMDPRIDHREPVATQGIARREEGRVFRD